GGMAEVYVARAEGPQGFEKLLAVKRMLPAFASQGDFERRFVREARVAAMLHHPNIGQVFDFGTVDGSLYIAMEFVDGVDLGELLSAAKHAGTPVPLGVVMAIAIELISALQFAHEAKSRDGEPLHLVHRDVSPSNLIVSYSGHTKLIDFGIASAADDLSTTRTGDIIGKYRYMSPEQVVGAKIDARSDIFAAGVVLWELLTSRRLFDGPNSAAIVHQISGGDIEPPSQHREIPPALDAIVMRCLDRSKHDRYQRAGDLRRELEEIARVERLDATAHAVATFVETAKPRKIVSAAAAAGTEVLVDPIGPTAYSGQLEPSKPESSEAATVDERPPSSWASAPATEPEPGATTGATSPEARPRSGGSRWWLTPLSTLVVLVAAGLVWHFYLRPPAEMRAAAAPADAALAPSTTKVEAPFNGGPASPAPSVDAAAGKASKPATKKRSRVDDPSPKRADNYDSIVLTLELDSNPSGAKVILHERLVERGRVSPRELCTTPCKKRTRVYGFSYQLEIVKEGCGIVLTKAVADGDHRVARRYVLRPLKRLGSSCLYDRHESRAARAGLTRRHGPAMNDCFPPDRGTGYAPIDWHADLSIEASGQVTSAQVQLDEALKGSLAGLESRITACLGRVIRSAKLLPAKRAGKVRVSFGSP
ncbi:MAG: serine/threonine protein kinase, partial [Deltaproteobacteria bacterium]|nr:serine/threonine protein kinase [Deltaproteobacteria bacterium]